jgi:hypothetical protein
MGWSTALTGWVGSAELYEGTKIQDKKYSHFFSTACTKKRQFCLKWVDTLATEVTENLNLNRRFQGHCFCFVCKTDGS